ncbi:MAG: CDP-diacylglycerol--glycerol-3-phosphate 3-phosphatidyltransferase [Clostridia bacterium]
MLKKIPNILTIIRLLMIPVFSFLLLERLFLAAGIVYIAATLTDVLDGFLARRLDAVTNFGKIADPAADKLLHFAAIVILCILGRLHVVFAILFFAKEALMLLGGILLYKRNYVVEANWFGKLATVAMNASIAASMIFNLPAPAVNLLIGAAMLTHAFALALYTKKYFRVKKELEERQ